MLRVCNFVVTAECVDSSDDDKVDALPSASFDRESMLRHLPVRQVIQFRKSSFPPNNYCSYPIPTMDQPVEKKKKERKEREEGDVLAHG